MKMNRLVRILLWFGLATVCAGCVHRIDWTGRVGHYTYDQAVTEMGPPDKQARLTDGRLVAEWISRYYGGGTAVVGMGYYGSPGAVGIVQTPPNYYESKLRLTFGTNYVLAAWAKD